MKLLKKGGRSHAPSPKIISFESRSALTFSCGASQRTGH